MKWAIEFFNDTVEADTLSLPAKILAKMLHIFEMIEEHEEKGDRLLFIPLPSPHISKQHSTFLFSRKVAKQAKRSRRDVSLKRAYRDPRTLVPLGTTASVTALDVGSRGLSIFFRVLRKSSI